MLEDCSEKVAKRLPGRRQNPHHVLNAFCLSGVSLDEENPLLNVGEQLQGARILSRPWGSTVVKIGLKGLM